MTEELAMRMKPKRRLEHNDLAELGKAALGKSLCKKCGEPALPERDTCLEYPNCKHVSSRRMIHKILKAK